MLNNITINYVVFLLLEYEVGIKQNEARVGVVLWSWLLDTLIIYVYYN